MKNKASYRETQIALKEVLEVYTQLIKLFSLAERTLIFIEMATPILEKLNWTAVEWIEFGSLLEKVTLEKVTGK